MPPRNGMPGRICNPCGTSSWNWGCTPTSIKAEEGCIPWMPWRSFGRKCAAFLNPCGRRRKNPWSLGKATGNRRRCAHRRSPRGAGNSAGAPLCGKSGEEPGRLFAGTVIAAGGNLYFQRGQGAPGEGQRPGEACPIARQTGRRFFFLLPGCTGKFFWCGHACWSPWAMWP